MRRSRRQGALHARMRSISTELWMRCTFSSHSRAVSEVRTPVLPHSLLLLLHLLHRPSLPSPEPVSRLSSAPSNSLLHPVFLRVQLIPSPDLLTFPPSAVSSPACPAPTAPALRSALSGLISPNCSAPPSMEPRHLRCPEHSTSVPSPTQEP